MGCGLLIAAMELQADFNKCIEAFSADHGVRHGVHPDTGRPVVHIFDFLQALGMKYDAARMALNVFKTSARDLNLVKLKFPAKPDQKSRQNHPSWAADTETLYKLILTLPTKYSRTFKNLASAMLREAHENPAHPHHTDLKAAHHEAFTDKPKADNDEMTEYEVVETIQRKLGGQREFEVPTGAIDLYMHPYVIEVKKAELWKHGLGQVLAYSAQIPGSTPVLWLFQHELVSESLPLISTTCAQFDVHVCLFDADNITLPPLNIVPRKRRKPNNDNNDAAETQTINKPATINSIGSVNTLNINYA